MIRVIFKLFFIQFKRQVQVQIFDGSITFVSMDELSTKQQFRQNSFTS